RLLRRIGTINLVADAFIDQPVSAKPPGDVFRAAAPPLEQIGESKRSFYSQVDGSDIASGWRASHSVVPGEKFSLCQGTEMKPQFGISLPYAKLGEAECRSVKQLPGRTVGVDDLAVAKPISHFPSQFQSERTQI
ncbi:MAG: hypothetical protein ACREU4_00655, partial [Burkholderiales bacterium]